MNTIHLVPAYGRIRTIRTATAAKESWITGEDWRISNGPYTSIRDRAKLLEISTKIFLNYRNTNGRPHVINVTKLQPRRV